jgi:hypothetical protein
MSFRDFTSGNNRHEGADVDGANNGRQYTPQQMKKNSLRRARSGSNMNTNKSKPMVQRFESIEFCRSKSESDYVVQSLIVQQREEEYAIQVMEQREEELRDIHRKMHVVNEIYKELGEVVEQQQDQIDQIEVEFEGAAESTRRGLEQIEKANKKRERRKDERDGEGGDGDGPDKAKQFFLFHYLSKTAAEISKLLSVCGGSGSINFVDDGCCKP